MTNFNKKLAAHKVAVIVIDMLEIVDVHEYQGEGSMMSRGPCKFHLKCSVEITGVEKFRKVISDGKFCHLLIERGALYRNRRVVDNAKDKGEIVFGERFIVRLVDNLKHPEDISFVLNGDAHDGFCPEGCLHVSKRIESRIF